MTKKHEHDVVELECEGCGAEWHYEVGPGEFECTECGDIHYVDESAQE